MKTTTPITGLATLLLTAATATAGSETQTFDYTWDSSQPLNMFTINRFDTQGGTRELTGVTLTLDATMSFDLLVENNNDFALNAGEFFVDADDIGFLSFVDETPGSSFPFFGLGGITLGGVTGDLAASDGTVGPFGGGNGTGPDTLIRSASGTINSVLPVQPFLLDDFLLDGPIEAIFGPFSDIRVDGFGVSAQIFNQSQSGTLGVTYDFTVVPAPGAGLALFGGLGLVARRRRS